MYGLRAVGDIRRSTDPKSSFDLLKSEGPAASECDSQDAPRQQGRLGGSRSGGSRVLALSELARSSAQILRCPTNDCFLKRLRKKAKKGMHGWRAATIAFYSPDANWAAKVVIGIVCPSTRRSARSASGSSTLVMCAKTPYRQKIETIAESGNCLVVVP